MSIVEGNAGHVSAGDSVGSMKTIYLVSCVSEKRALDLPAEQLYCSDWFQKARSYVLRRIKDGDEWRILSAKYGLLHPNTKVAPYNETLNDMRKSQRVDWSRRVINELRCALQAGDIVVFLAGQKYREFLEPAVSARKTTMSPACNAQRSSLMTLRD